MRNMVISLALGAGAIFASPAADAAPLTNGGGYGPGVGVGIGPVGVGVGFGPRW